MNSGMAVNRSKAGQGLCRSAKLSASWMELGRHRPAGRVRVAVGERKFARGGAAGI